MELIEGLGSVRLIYSRDSFLENYFSIYTIVCSFKKIHISFLSSEKFLESQDDILNWNYTHKCLILDSDGDRLWF